MTAVGVSGSQEAYEDARAALTPAQRRVLAALCRVTEDGWPATVRDVMRAAGLGSPSTAFYHLYDLEGLGLAAKHPRSERGGWLPVTPA